MREYGKRRIINDDRSRGIAGALVVAAGIKRTNELRFGELILLPHPIGDGVVNVIGSVAVVRRFGILEFVKEFVIFVVAFLTARVVPVLTVEPIRRARHVQRVKAELRHVDIKNIAELRLQRVVVPFGELRRPVMRYGIGAALFVVHVIKANNGNFLQPEFFRGEKSAVPFDDDILLAPYPDRIIKAEILYALFYHSDVFFFMPASIALIGL